MRMNKISRPRGFIVGMVLGLMALTSLLWAATYSITTTAAQETRITRRRTIYNAQNPGAPYASNDAAITAVCTQAMVTWIADVEDGDAAALANRARNATQAQRDAACTSLGGTVVNGRCT